MTAPVLDLPTARGPAPAPVWSGPLLPTNTPAGDGRVMLRDDSGTVPARRL